MRRDDDRSQMSLFPSVAHNVVAGKTHLRCLSHVQILLHFVTPGGAGGVGVFTTRIVHQGCTLQYLLVGWFNPLCSLVEPDDLGAAIFLNVI